jgi:signal transduction histidine kinase
MSGRSLQEHAESSAGAASVLVVEVEPAHDTRSLRHVLEKAIESARRERDDIGLSLASCRIDDLEHAIARHAPHILIVDFAALGTRPLSDISMILESHKTRWDLPVVMGVRECERTLYVEMPPCADDYLRLPGDDSRNVSLVADFLKYKLRTILAERARRRDSEALNHRVKLEKLIAEISTHLIHCSSENESRCIDSALSSIAEVVGLSRAWLGLVEQGVVECVHEWCAEGFPQRMTGLAKRPLSNGTRASFHLIAEHAGALRVESLADKEERESLEAQGIALVLGTPLDQDGELVGFLGGDSPFDERERLSDDIRALRTIGAALMRQIARQRMLSELKQAAKQRVRHEERLSLMSEMARSVVHDFRNVLTLISCSSDMMLMSPEILEDKERVRRDLLQIKKAVLDLDNMLRRLRQFYRPKGESEVFQPIDLSDLVQGVLGIIAYQIESQTGVHGMSLEVRPELPGDLPTILGNDTELREVVTNLILNAVDATVQTNEDRASTKGRAGVLSIRTLAENGGVLLEVMDNGVGMTAEVLQRCMEPDFSTKGSRGMGLGLALVSGVVQRHNGAVEIESEWGHGTTVRIRLPLRADESADEAETTPRLSILLVDDDASVRELVCRFLTTKGHQVHLASCGREALYLFKQHWFDLVITDQKMPGDLSGEQLAAVVKDIAPRKPVIVLTDEDMAHKPGCVDLVMRKPFDLTTFRRAIQDLIRPASQLF